WIKATGYSSMRVTTAPGDPKLVGKYLSQLAAEQKRDPFDVVADLVIGDAFYRAQVEHELRAKLLRLRQKAAGVLSDKSLLLRLLVDSVSTFCTLFRHALVLAGAEAAYEKRRVVDAAAARFGIEPSPFHALLDLRERKTKPRDVDPPRLFEQYLKEIHVVVGAVDRLER
ncbi:MAG: hypothetical protein NT090_23385, partial [Acidobacteria bacterium]|nr:hypothetical protein [Acidobacteriota bacterium]